MKYRKKPVVVEAIQFTGVESVLEMEYVWCSEFIDCRYFVHPIGRDPRLTITTMEGKHRAKLGDYIIKGIAGEFYPCKEDIFLKTYEKVAS